VGGGVWARGAAPRPPAPPREADAPREEWGQARCEGSASQSPFLADAENETALATLAPGWPRDLVTL
jgi:hypothetical protein